MLQSHTAHQRDKWTEQRRLMTTQCYLPQSLIRDMWGSGHLYRFCCGHTHCVSKTKQEEFLFPPLFSLFSCSPWLDCNGVYFASESYYLGRKVPLSSELVGVVALGLAVASTFHENTQDVIKQEEDAHMHKAACGIHCLSPKSQIS